MMLVVLLLAVAGPSPQTIMKPRQAYSSCLSQFEKKSVADKLAPAAYSAAIKSACAAEAAAFTKALVAYDMGMGTKRASAEANAVTDLADYMATSEERFGFKVTPDTPK